MSDLKHVPIAQLLEAVASRRIELREGPLQRLTDEAFELTQHLVPTVCVDGIARRRNDRGEIELMALRRKTGPYPGKLVLIGGTILFGEPIKKALKRHFQDDLGEEIIVGSKSFDTTQYHEGPPDNEWLQDPGKLHVIATVYCVTFSDNIPEDCSDGTLEWFTYATMPDASEFGYGVGRIYKEAFLWLRSYRG